jgi:Fuc2NAc and GlcNAc transferase
LLTIVWLTNLYNFMDGIDGIAATQAMFVAATAALLLGLHGDGGSALLCLLIAMACSGFLYWNWPPARLFMGDVGSGFLGYCFAVLAIASENSGQLPLTVWLVLLSLFIGDASYTLLSRLLRGKRVYEAHREHAYQYLVRRSGSHRKVTIGWGLLNLLIILPLALLASFYTTVTPLLVALLYGAIWLMWQRARSEQRHD